MFLGVFIHTVNSLFCNTFPNSLCRDCVGGGGFTSVAFSPCSAFGASQFRGVVRSCASSSTYPCAGINGDVNTQKVAKPRLDQVGSRNSPCGLQARIGSDRRGNYFSQLAIWSSVSPLKSVQLGQTMIVAVARFFFPFVFFIGFL